MIYTGRKWCVRCPYSLQTEWSRKEECEWGDPEGWQELICLGESLRSSRLEEIEKLSYLVLLIPSQHPHHIVILLGLQGAAQRPPLLLSPTSIPPTYALGIPCCSILWEKNSMPAVYQAVCLWFFDCSRPSCASCCLFIYSGNKHVLNTYTMLGSVLDIVIEWRERQPRSCVLLDLSF